MEESGNVGFLNEGQGREDAVCTERESSTALAIEALSIMLRLQGDKAGMDMEGSQYVNDPESDIRALKDAVCAQQILLQKLNAELDTEREASASAASEALAMILRLQGEKAAVTMEASQYKRMAEEKISHDEECLTLFEDVIYQKEMEIASLEYQVQAYRCKLLSLGFNDLGFIENRIPESLLLPRNDSINGDLTGKGGVRRMSSLPPIKVKDSYYKASSTERKKSVTPGLDLTLGTVRESKSPECNIQSPDLEKNKKTENCGAGDLDLCWNNVKKLNGQVKEIPMSVEFGKDRSAGLKGAPRLSSLVSQASTSSSFLRARSEASIKDQIQFSKSLSEAAANSACSSAVLDIFEIPKHDNICKDRVHEMKEQSNFREGESRLGNPDVVSHEAFKLRIKDEMDLPKKIHRDELSKARDLKKTECHLASVHTISAANETQVQFQQLSQRIRQLEDERCTVRQEINVEGTEELHLLKEIRDKLDSIQSEIVRNKTKKASTWNDSPSVSTLQEAMLYFWL